MSNTNDLFTQFRAALTAPPEPVEAGYTSKTIQETPVSTILSEIIVKIEDPTAPYFQSERNGIRHLFVPTFLSYVHSMYLSSRKEENGEPVNGTQVWIGGIPIEADSNNLPALDEQGNFKVLTGEDGQPLPEAKLMAFTIEYGFDRTKAEERQSSVPSLLVKRHRNVPTKKNEKGNVSTDWKAIPSMEAIMKNAVTTAKLRGDTAMIEFASHIPVSEAAKRAAENADSSGFKSVTQAGKPAQQDEEEETNPFASSPEAPIETEAKTEAPVEGAEAKTKAKAKAKA